VTTGLAGIATKAKADPKCRFTSLAHMLTPEFLKETWQVQPVKPYTQSVRDRPGDLPDLLR